MISKIFSFFLICFLTISKGQAMSISDVGKVCTFSSVRAKVTYNGELVKNSKVTRWTKWKDASTEVTTTTDDGVFEFPAIFEKSISKYLPIEIVITQVITIEYGGHPYKVWINTKMKPEENAELGGSPLNLECELTEEPVFYEDFGPLLETNCTWEK
jgi:hypothetical protein